MNDPGPAPAHRGLRLIALTAAAVCVLALLAGAFVLSYAGARATAVNAGVNTSFGRLYPGIFDAVLLVACAAALVLRRAWRVVAWLTVLVVIGTLAAADTVHVMSVTLPKRPMEVTVAVVPWVVLLVGLILLDAMARQGRPGRNAVPRGRATGPGQPNPTEGYRNGALPSRTTVPLSALLADKRRPAARGPAVEPAAATASSPATPPMTWPTSPATHPGQPAPQPTQPAVSPVPTAPGSATQPFLKPTAQITTPPAADATSQPAVQAAVQPAASPASQQTGRQPAPPAPAIAPAGRQSAEPATEPQQAPARQPATVSPAKLPEPTPPQPDGRDEPSAGDASPSEPGAFSSRLRRPLVASGKTATDGKPPSSEPAASKPAATEPVASEPPSTGPAATGPAATGPAASKPAATGPAASKPAATEPAPSEPAASEPTGSESAAGDPVASKPATTKKPAAGKPVATKKPAASKASAAQSRKAESGG